MWVVNVVVVVVVDVVGDSVGSAVGERVGAIDGAGVGGQTFPARRKYAYRPPNIRNAHGIRLIVNLITLDILRNDFIWTTVSISTCN